MKKKKIYFSVNLMFLFTLLVLIFGGSLVSYNYYKAKQNAYLMLDKITSQMSKNITYKTLNYLHKTDSHLKTLANYNKKLNDIIEYKTRTRRLLWEFLITQPHIASIYIGDFKGNFIQARRDPKLATRIIKNLNGKRVDIWEYRYKDYKIIKKETKIAKYDPRVRPWYKAGIEEKIYVSKPYVFSSTKKMGITIFYPYFKNNQKKFVAAVDITLEQLNSFLKKETEIFKGEIVLLDNKKNIIATSQKNSKILNKAILLLNDKKRIEFKIKDTSYIAIYSKFLINNNSYWHIVFTIPKELILGEATKTLIKTIIMSVILLFIFIFFVILISKQISKPIIELSKNIEKLKDLELDIKIKNDSNISEINIAQNALISLKQGLSAFIKYMPSELVKILIQTNQEAKIGGKEKNLVIMFTDIANFTSIAEKVEPKELTLQLSEYFDVISNCISKFEGTVDKYIGDAVMAFWGAPLEIENPIEKAAIAIFEIKKEIDKLNKKWENQKKPIFITRIGLHYGKTLVGNIGSSKRMNYTIIGDSVNIASRLENINKIYGTQIIISEYVYKYIKNKFVVRYLDKIALKGKKEGIKIYELICNECKSDELLLQFLELFHQAIDIYNKKDYNKAKNLFTQAYNIKHDTVAKLYILRCEEFIKNPPPANWDGVYHWNVK